MRCALIVMASVISMVRVLHEKMRVTRRISHGKTLDLVLRNIFKTSIWYTNIDKQFHVNNPVVSTNLAWNRLLLNLNFWGETVNENKEQALNATHVKSKHQIPFNVKAS